MPNMVGHPPRAASVGGLPQLQNRINIAHIPERSRLTRGIAPGLSFDSAADACTLFSFAPALACVPHAGNAVSGSSHCQIRFTSASGLQGRLATDGYFLSFFNFQS
jgi:hypothetical protein